MGQMNQTRCASCGQMIRTLSRALRMRQAPVVCRRCFGNQTYESKATLPISAIAEAAQASADV